MSESTSTTSPVYADKSTGEKFASATAMVNAYLRRFAEHFHQGEAEVPALDDAGYVQTQRGSATIGVNVLEEQGVLMVFSPIMAVPITGREMFYRRLLELSFVTTSDAAFAINAPQDEVVVRCFRRLSGLDYEEFEDILATVGEVADRWDDELMGEYGT